MRERKRERREREKEERREKKRKRGKEREREKNKTKGFLLVPELAGRAPQSVADHQKCSPVQWRISEGSLSLFLTHYYEGRLHSGGVIGGGQYHFSTTPCKLLNSK